MAAAPAVSACMPPVTIPGQRSCARCATRCAHTPAVISPAIRVWEFRPAVELLLDGNGQVAGAILKDMDNGLVFARQRQGGSHRHGGQRSPALPGIPDHQPLRRYRGWPGAGLPPRSPPGIHRYHAVPPHGCCLPRTNPGAAGYREGARPGRPGLQRRWRAVRLPAGDARCRGGCFHPRVLRAPERRRHPHRDSRLCGWIRP